MDYIEKMFKDANIDVYINETWPDEPDRKNSNLCIIFRYGDEIDGFTYRRTLCVYDCINFISETSKIIESDIRLIKSEIRRVKLKSLGL